jgi:beta-glucuronidase
MALARALACAAVLVLCCASRAAGQGPVYVPQPPTKGALYLDGQADRYLLGGTWLLRVDRGDVGLNEGWWRNVATTDGWSPVTVPNAYNAGDLSDGSMYGYVGWYRKDFVLPGGAFPPGTPRGDRRWIVRFESVNYTATVWLNGRRIGSHVGAFLPFEIVLRGLRRGVNRLIVRVDDRRGLADIPSGPSGGWWNYGGLLREVYLRAIDGAEIARAQVRPLLPCPSCAAQIEVKAVIRNLTDRPQFVSLSGSYGRFAVGFGAARIAPRGVWRPRATVRIAHPRLWAPGHPALYRASLTLYGRGSRLDTYLDLSGIRSIKLTADGRLKLNGHLLNLRGVNLHEQALGSGAALSSDQIRRLMGWVRELGATIVRAHYPLNPLFEELADRYGILIWAEIPVWHTFSRYLDRPGWTARAHAYLQDDILTNQNHPSILLWSIGNELATPATDAEAAYIRGAVALAHRVDPTRPVGMAISDWPGVPCQSAYGPLDVIGFNDYFGWFDAGGGTTDDRDALSPFLDSLRACYPHTALFVSEFGFEGDRNGPVEERGTYQFQSNTIAFHLQIFASKPWLSGAMYFPLQDFVARPGWSGGDPLPHPPFVLKGLLDLDGNAKPAFYLIQSAYLATVQLARRR